MKTIGAWVINQKYVTIEERQEANAEIDFNKTISPPDYLASGETAVMINPRKKVFLEKFHRLFPNRNKAELQKLKYIVEDLEYKCELDWNKNIE